MCSLNSFGNSSNNFFIVINITGITGYKVSKFSIIDAIAPMFDEESDVSVNHAEVDKADDKFKELYSSYTLYEAVAKYVKSKKDIFVE